MPDDPRILAEATVCGVLEEFAFMLAEPIPPTQIPPLDGRPLRVRMTFRGPVSGTILMAVPEALAEVLAANSLGLDVERAGAESFAEDALKELLNVLTGHLVARLGGRKEPVQFSTPVRIPLDPSDWDASRKKADALGFQVEEHPLLILLEFTNGGVPQ